MVKLTKKEIKLILLAISYSMPHSEIIKKYGFTPAQIDLVIKRGKQLINRL
jgi:hypothetical protein